LIDGSTVTVEQDPFGGKDAEDKKLDGEGKK
jgi:hypothetical protein